MAANYHGTVGRQRPVPIHVQGTVTIGGVNIPYTSMTFEPGAELVEWEWDQLAFMDGHEATITLENANYDPAAPL